MDIDDRIANKEFRIYIIKNTIDMLEDTPGIDKNYIQKHYDDIEDLKKSIKEDREVQKIEAARSGRKTWKEDAWKYFLVSVGTAIVVLVFKYFLDKI